MFNWLKNKLNNLIPSDLNKGFLTSNYVTVKVGDKITIPQNITNDINEKLKKHLNKIGLDLTSFSITTFNLKHSMKKDLEEKNNSVLPENLLVENKNDTNILDQHKEIDYNQTNAIQQNCNACSNCGSKIIKGSLFCHRCGHYL